MSRLHRGRRQLREMLESYASDRGVAAASHRGRRVMSLDWFRHGGEHHDCSEILERVFFFIDNELPTADHSEIEQHLDECAPCLRKYDLERTVKTLVQRSCTEHAPPALREKVLLPDPAGAGRDHRDAQPGVGPQSGRIAGSVNANVVPTPGLLWHVTSPLWSST